MTGYVLRDIIRRQGRRARRLTRQEPTMTEHDTTDHVARIREFCDELRAASLENPNSPDYRFMQKAADGIQSNLERLAARLAAAETERDGWKRLAEGWEDDFREQMQGQHGEYVENTIQQMRSAYLPDTDGSDDDAE